MSNKSESESAIEILFLLYFVMMAFLNVIVDRNVLPEEIDKANEICKNANSELEKMNVGSFFVDVTCTNGGEFRFPVKYVEDK